MKKTVLKTRNACKVTFELPKAAVAGAKKIFVVGDFNEWRENETSLKKRKDGSFSVTLELPRGRSYRFRYLLDGKRWENDWSADRYEPSGLGGEENSVVEV